MRFKFLSGDVNPAKYGAKWISNKLNNGDFDYWLVMELINMDEACGRDNEGKSRYIVELSAVSPSQCPEVERKRAMESCGYGTPPGASISDEAWVEMIHSYGVKAVLWSKSGNNYGLLLGGARREALVSSSLFGFYMDRPQNRIGTTGWEMIRGDITAGLHRTIASGSTTGRILAKMHGIVPPQTPPEKAVLP